MKSRKKNHRQIKPDQSGKGKRVSGKTGLPPGSLIHIGKILTDSVTVRITEFNENELNQHEVKNLDGFKIPDDSLQRWIEIIGLQETNIIESFGKTLQVLIVLS